MGVKNMPLYCYIVETGMYEDVEAHILGHTTKYSQEEFDNICIKLTEKYGDVEEIEYFSSYDTSDVKQIKYNIDSYRLIKLLIRDYGFIELNVPINDGHNTKEISRTPVPSERLQKVIVKPRFKCPVDTKIEDGIIFCKTEDIEYDPIIMHPNARCVFNKKEDSVD